MKFCLLSLHQSIRYSHQAYQSIGMCIKKAGEFKSLNFIKTYNERWISLAYFP